MRLTEKQRTEIKAHLKEGVLNQSQIAKKVGVHRSTVSRIKKAMLLEQEKTNWGDKVRLVLAGFLQLNIIIPQVAEHCSSSESALYELWNDINRDAFERTYRSLGYAATRIFEGDFTPELQLRRLESIGKTVQQAMGSISWSVAAKRTTWILEHRGVD